MANSDNAAGRQLILRALEPCLLLLMTYDRPFAAGGVTISPTAYREINFD